MRKQGSQKHAIRLIVLAGILWFAKPVWGQQLVAALQPAGSVSAPAADITVLLPTAPSPCRVTPAYAPPIQPLKSGRISAPESVPSRKAWLLLAIAEHSAAGFDGYTTRRAIQLGAVESNPFVRPFAQSSAVYPVLQTTPFLLDFVGRRMQRSHVSVERHLWWLPQTLSAAVSVSAGIHNLHVATH
jgi:hypothetical protein